MRWSLHPYQIRQETHFIPPSPGSCDGNAVGFQLYFELFYRFGCAGTIFKVNEMGGVHLLLQSTPGDIHRRKTA